MDAQVCLKEPTRSLSAFFRAEDVGKGRKCCPAPAKQSESTQCAVVCGLSVMTSQVNASELRDGIGTSSTPQRPQPRDQREVIVISQRPP